MTHDTTPTSDHDPGLLKEGLRTEARRLRARAFAKDGEAWAETLAGHAGLLPIWRGCQVAGYWPMGAETDSRPLMRVLANIHGCGLLLPAIRDDGSLDFRPWALDAPLEAGPRGTCHPPARLGRQNPDLVLVPLLSFDSRGFRLGQGGGYYDRTLAVLRRRGKVVAVGVAFACQKVEALPVDPWDQPLDAVLTENGLMKAERA